MQINKPSNAVLIALIILILPAVSGCQDSLRFAPTQAQKATAELTHSLAVKANAEGIEPASPASQQLAQGTQAALSYIGRPAIPPNAEMFDTVAGQASQDALQRLDPWTVADNLFELGIGIAALLGGVYGVKTAQYLRTAREKARALKEVVQGNELFMTKTTIGHAQAFKEAQNTVQTPITKKLVTELKA